MAVLLEGYLDRLEALHAGVEEAIDGLPQEALDWVPGPDMSSLGVLVVHIAGSQRYWIGEVAGGDPSGRDREAEFRSGGLDGKALRQRLADALAHSRRVLREVSGSDLGAERVLPRNGRKVTVVLSLAHALEHTGIHLGHVQITRQLWDHRTKDSQT